MIIVEVQPVGVSGLHCLHLPDRGGAHEPAERPGCIRYWAYQVCILFLKMQYKYESIQSSRGGKS